jgi:lipoprotein-releasing system permease protein
LKRVFIVKGVYNTGLEEYDKRFIVGHAKILQDILGWSSGQYSGIELFADHKEEIKILNDNIFEWLKLQDINEKVIFQLMGVVAMSNLITVLLILILERTKMVGVLKSIGASNWTIRWIFIFQATFILLIGLLLGNLLGLGFCFFQKSTSLLKLDEQNYYLAVVPIKITWSKIFIINFLAFLVCLITLIIPSILVSKIRPVTALKFD